MTKKEQLIKDYEQLKDKGIECIVLFIHMPTGETEVITNPRADEKIAYVNKTYDDNLVHENCEQIYIEDYAFSLKQDVFDFGSAIANLKEGHKVARKGWNGKGMFVYYVPANSYKSCTEIGNSIADENGMVSYEPYFAIRNVKGTVSTWVPSINDCLAEDWVVVE